MTSIEHDEMIEVSQTLRATAGRLMSGHCALTHANAEMIRAAMRIDVWRERVAPIVWKGRARGYEELDFVLVRRLAREARKELSSAEIEMLRAELADAARQPDLLDAA